MENAVQIQDADIQVQSNVSPAQMMQMALAQKGDLTGLKDMLELQKQWEAHEAKKAYHKAMAAFKANPPDIDKDREVDFTTKTGIRTNYRHASLHNVATKINQALSKHGLSAAWRTEQPEGGIRVTCTITHELGHSESTSLTAGADQTGNKNPIQAISSTVSYLERYTILALTGLATRDMDDDGNAAGTPPPAPITEPQAIELTDMAEAAPGGIDRFKPWLKAAYKVDSVHDLNEVQYTEIRAALDKAIRKAK